MERTKRLTVDVTEKMHREVKAKAALEGMTVSDALRLILTHWLEGKIALDKGKK